MTIPATIVIAKITTLAEITMTMTPPPPKIVREQQNLLIPLILTDISALAYLWISSLL